MDEQQKLLQILLERSRDLFLITIRECDDHDAGAIWCRTCDGTGRVRKEVSIAEILQEHISP